MEQLKTVINSFVPMSDEEYDLILPIINQDADKKDTNLLKQWHICDRVCFIESGFFRMRYVDLKIILKYLITAP